MPHCVGSAIEAIALDIEYNSEDEFRKNGRLAGKEANSDFGETLRPSKGLLN